MTIISPRNLLCCSSLCLLLLAGCGGSATEAESDRLTHPFTWDEWVEREAGERDEFNGSQFFGVGLPNMSKWRADDFLSADYLGNSHVDVCTLPREKRDDVYHMARRLWGDNKPENLRDELELAAQGFMEPQARMGTYCSSFLNDAHLEPGELTMAEALDWTRRAAASEDPRAMYRLADCMMKIVREREAFEDSAGMSLNPFWLDEAYYWLQRAALEYLDIFALQDLQSRTTWMMISGGTNRLEGQIEKYLYSRLMELNGIFHRKPQRYGWPYVKDMARIESSREELTERNALASGEERVREWLHAHPDVWDNIYFHPMDSFHSVCPEEKDYSARFDYDSLNKELAAYGLEVNPPFAAENVGHNQAASRELIISTDRESTPWE